MTVETDLTSQAGRKLTPYRYGDNGSVSEGSVSGDNADQEQGQDRTHAVRKFTS